MGYLIVICLFFGTIFYWLIKKIWKSNKPKASPSKLNPLLVIILISALIFILIEYLINNVLHTH